MENKGLLQKDLAKLLAKSEAEISRMLTGSHNLTVKTISKIEAVLGAKIITTPYRVEEERIELDTNIQLIATATNMIDNENNHWERSEAGKYSFAMAS
jgi:plasmid maintenance system antidote protein VapI